MPKGSIAARLFWLSALWLIVALAATAFLLSELYSRSLDRGLTDSLEFNIQTLVARTLEAGTAEAETIVAADPRFQRPASGWYWQITGEDGSLYNLSGSVVGSMMPVADAPFDAMGSRAAILVDDFGTRVRLIERRVNTAGEDLRFAVTGNLDEINAETASFRSQTLIVLFAVGVMLAVMSASVARVALRPVGQLRQEIEEVREGDSSRVTGDYPRELVPLATELNELLRSNAEIVERSRSHVGNLAHGLKTPLAVLRNESANSRTALAKTVSAETDRMSALVTNYLDRARLAARTSVVGQRSDAAEVLTRLARVMAKLHSERDITYSPSQPGQFWFRGEEGDLEEMAGNLLDNACKWAKSEVRVALGRVDGDQTSQLLITIEDDGPGMTGEEREQALKRGVRLDEKVPGSGLGLDIVKELVDIYGGSLDLSDSVLGGVQVKLTLPAAKSPN